LGRIIVETDIFKNDWKRLELSEDDKRDLDITLFLNPKAGVVIKNTGGARKLRIEAHGHGKSGGARIIYVDFAVKEKIYLLVAYAKTEKEDLEESEKKAVKQWIGRIANE